MEVTSGEDEFNVKWGNHHRAIIDVLEQLYTDETYVDCSIATEGQEISAHKLILSACSPFLREVLKKHRDKHPVIVLKDVNFSDLRAVVEYMYKGEVKIAQNRLRSFLKTAEMLEVTGLGLRKRTTSESSTISQSSPKRMKDVQEIDDKIEYLSDEAETEKEDYKFFFVDESGNYKELGDNPNLDDLSSTGKSEIEALMKQSYSEPGGTASEVPMSMDSPTKSPLSSNILRYRSLKQNEYSLSCSKCFGFYKNESSFVNHLRHDCNQLHQCDQCSKTFKNKRHLLDHVRDDCGRVHSCPKCHKLFKQKVNLTTHQKHYCKT